jgi:hypothetical protein
MAFPGEDPKTIAVASKQSYHRYSESRHASESRRASDSATEDPARTKDIQVRTDLPH